MALPEQERIALRAADAESKAREREYAALGLELLLFALQSPVNIGMILRIAEAYHFTASILDLHGVLDDPEKLKTLEDFSCGSLGRRGFVRLRDAAAAARHCRGRRLIVTSILPDAEALPGFAFGPRDIVAVGNEYDGLPDALVAKADVRLHIPLPELSVPKPASWHPIDPTRNSVRRDGTPNLNVAMAAGIICYAVYTDWTARQRSPHSAIRI